MSELIGVPRTVVAEWRQCSHCEHLSILFVPEQQFHQAHQTQLDHITNHIHTLNRCVQIGNSTHLRYGAPGTSMIRAQRLSPNTTFLCPQCHTTQGASNRNQWHVCWRSHTSLGISYTLLHRCRLINLEKPRFASGSKTISTNI